MEVRRDVLLGIITLVAFYLALCFAAVGLQQRLEPTLSTIEDRNVVSIASALELLSTLDSNDRGALEALAETLVRYETEEGERVLATRILTAIEQPELPQGDEYKQLIRDLEEIADLNRTAMMEYSNQAFRLAQGGGWVLITLAAIGIWAAWFVIRRLQQRIVQPLEHLAETMRRGQSGTTRMRAYAQYAAYEIREAAEALNALLDDRAMNYERRHDKISRPERNIVVALMEKVPYPTWVLDENGEIRAANQLGMESQQGHIGRRIKGYLRAIAARQYHDANVDYPKNIFEAVDLGDEDHLLCILIDAEAVKPDKEEAHEKSPP